MAGAANGPVVGVIDIGSNSGRIVVYRVDTAGVPRIVAATRAALRLVGEVDARHALGAEASARTFEALRDFRAIARGAGATRLFAVATAAMRDAEDGPALVDRARAELGVEIEIIDGAREARLGLRGGISGLPVESGLLFDLGGGSMQLTRFEGRALREAWSLPLGSLRLSNAFLRDDPPGRDAVRALRRHVRRALRTTGPPRLAPGEALVGTGGSIRNLAKADRKRRDYPITRVHGYALEADRLAALARKIARRTRTRREAIPGITGERGDSIAGGALAIDVLAEEVGATAVLVSGQGVREGLVLALAGEDVPPLGAVRERALASLTTRFRDWNPDTAERRARLSAALYDAMERPGEADLREALVRAARLLDIGRSLDFYDRHDHAAEVLIGTDLLGHSHREIALTAAVLRAGADEEEQGRRLQPLVRRRDRPAVERAGVLLALADDIEERCPPGAAVDARVTRGAGAAVIAVPALDGWRARRLGERFLRVFGESLDVRAGGFDRASTGP
jgi:exopolyphosphatase/guanosine-5'-triphosphate,3'-diphosphate pyrophosphatase